MKITSKLLSIPPYISTSWHNIIALHVKNEDLVISLANGETIEIPGLSTDTLHAIFVAHSSYLDYEANLEAERRNQAQMPPSIQALLAADPQQAAQMRFGFSSLEDPGQLMQHNPAQADAPDIPFEILQKIAAIAKIIAPESEDVIPQAEPNCNCMHCQLSRAIHGDTIAHTIIEVQNDPWEVSQVEEKLYLVTNKADTNDHYNVYLGEPVGCTCGVNGCAHVLAVLRS